jgi:outer membrane lipoprotein-sorting protein
MKTAYLLLAAALCVCFVAQASAITADEVIAKNIEAKGGMDKLQQIKTEKVTGKWMMAGMEMPFTMYTKRPNKLRMEVSMQGMTMVQAFDGETGWDINPFQGSPEPKKMSDMQSKMFGQQADFDGFLIGYKDKGYKVEYMGEEDMEGTPAYHLVVTVDDSTTVDYYIDTEYNLDLKYTVNAKVEGTPLSVDSYLGDYKEVDGVMTPFSMENKVNGQTRGQGVFEKVEYNVDIPDSLFVMPPTVEKEQAPPEETKEESGGN